MTGYQGVVLVFGAGLGLAELTARQIPQSLYQAITSKGSGNQATVKPFPWEQSRLGTITITVGFVGITTFFAGLSDDAGKLMLALVAAAWLLFLVQNSGNLKSLFGG